MNKLFRKTRDLEFQPRAVPLALLMVTLLAYGMFFWQMGFYWDDLPISWIRYQLGTEALRLYFSTSRPVWGELYLLTTRFMPQVPMAWQLFAIFWRWLGVVVLWMILRIVWPNRRQLALTVSLLFLLYPGYNQQWVSFLSSHFFIVLFFLLFSILLMLWSFQQPKWYWPLTIAGMFFSALNLWMLEYFFFLELIRPFVILQYYTHPRAEDPPRALRQSITVAARRWLPYLAVFVADVLYRQFVYTNPIHENVLISNLRLDPAGTIVSLAANMLTNLWRVSAQAWAQAAVIPDPATTGPRTLIFYIVVVLLTAGLVVLFRARNEETDRRMAWRVVGLGSIAMLVGGGPYWLAQLEITLGFPANRFAISFALGVSLLLAGLLELLPARARLSLAAVLVALAAGRHALWADAFRRDWNTQKSMFWQMSWRAPGLQPDTLVLMNEYLQFYADNSLSPVLNWIYLPDDRTSRIEYVLFYPTNRIGMSLPALEPDLPVRFDYWAGVFEGNTSRTVAFYFSPPACLHVLDPELDPENRLILDDSLMRQAAALSSTAFILEEQTARMPEVYYPEPSHGWCYYFERADLARQMGDWEQVAQLGDRAFALDDYPNDPTERFVFIEGYAHTGDWQNALKYSQTSYAVSKNIVGPLLCRLWERIERDVPASAEKEAALAEAKTLFVCKP